jgi:hypothetical protein
MTRAELDRQVLARIAAGAQAPSAEGEFADAEFERLALALFAHQYAAGSAYRRLCDSQGRNPGNVARWQDVPAVPTGAFKQARIAAFPPERCVRVFRSSGSTTERRSELQLDTLALYEAALLASFAAYILPEGRRLPFLVLAPSAADAPDSSLSYMYDCAARRLGEGEPRFYLTASGWDPDALIADLERLPGPAAVVGTAFAFVHLVDELGARGLRLALPEGTRLMETGGFKGRSRELERSALHRALRQALGVPETRIINQYGMCELASQFYEPSLVRGRVVARKAIPPWVRTRAVDPASLRDVPPGEVGMLVHYDLANTGSALAVQTSDAGRLVDGELEIHGRLPGAEARGCSLAAEALLAGA